MRSVNIVGRPDYHIPPVPARKGVPIWGLMLSVIPALFVFVLLFIGLYIDRISTKLLKG